MRSLILYDNVPCKREEWSQNHPQRMIVYGNEAPSYFIVKYWWKPFYRDWESIVYELRLIQKISENWDQGAQRLTLESFYNCHFSWYIETKRYQKFA